MANCRERCSSCRRRSAGRKARDDTILGGVDGGGVGGGGGHKASCKYNRSFFRGFFDFKIASCNSSLSKGAPVFGLISSNLGSTFNILYLYLSIRWVSRGCFQGQSPISTISFGSGSFTFFGVRRSMTFFFNEAVSALARILSSSVPPRSTCAEHRGLATQSERPHNRKLNHPRPRLMDTSRVDGVKAPQHRGTPRSYALRRHFGLDLVAHRLGDFRSCLYTPLHARGHGLVVIF